VAKEVHVLPVSNKKGLALKSIGRWKAKRPFNLTATEKDRRGTCSGRYEETWDGIEDEKDGGSFVTWHIFQMKYVYGIPISDCNQQALGCIVFDCCCEVVVSSHLLISSAA
jgi:hypothetical protein